MSERSVYLSGTSVFGIFLFINQTDPNFRMASKTYLLSLCISCACSIYVTATLTTASIFIVDTPEELKQEFAQRILVNCQICFLVYFVSFLTLILGVAFVGYGNNYPNDGADLCLWVAGAAILFLLYCVGNTIWNAARVKRGEVNNVSPVSLADARAKVVRMMSQINKYGGVATIPAGFVIQTLFNNDTITVDNRNRTQTNAYLILNCCTVCLGFLAAIIDSIITLFTNDFSKTSDKIAFLHSMRPMILCCQNFFQFSLLGWFISFSLAGTIIYKENYPTISYVAIVGGLFALLGVVYIMVLSTKLRSMELLPAEEEAGTATGPEGGSGGGSSLPAGKTMPTREEVESVVKRPFMLSIITGCAFFFGG